MNNELVFYTTPMCQLCKPIKNAINAGNYSINIRICDDIVEMSQNLIRSVPALKKLDGTIAVGAKQVSAYLEEWEIGNRS
jgi:hypothetical protein